MVGKPVTDLYKDPADRKKLIAQLSAKGFVREFEAVFKTRTGEEKVGSINAKLLINEDASLMELKVLPGISLTEKWLRRHLKSVQENSTLYLRTLLSSCF
jgi:hypothetical protein